MTHCRPDEGQGKGRWREEGEGGEGKAEGGDWRHDEGGKWKEWILLRREKEGVEGGGMYLHYQHMLQIGRHTEQTCPHQMATVDLQMGR